MKKLLFVLLSSFMVTTSAIAAIDVFEFDNDEKEQQFKELSAQLRCPKCQNNSISDSNSELAQDLRQKVYEMTKDGKNSDEIVEYMIDRYGNFVTYKPPFTIVTSILWLGPVLVILMGIGLIVYRSRNKTGTTNTARDWNEDKEERLKALLEENANGDKSQ